MGILNLKLFSVALAVFLGARMLPQAAPPAQDQQPKAAVAAPSTSAGSEELQKGKELLAAKNYTAAETSLRAAVAAQPNNPNAHLNLGIALLNNSKLAEAEQEFVAAAPLANGTPEEQKAFYQNRGALYARQEKWSQAEPDLQKAVQLNPKEPYNHYYLGVTQYRLKKPDKMVESLSMFLKLAPSAPEAPKCKALLKAVGR